MQELVSENLPVRHLVTSDFVFVNERLARHYQLPPVESVELHKVDLPPESPRGGLLTQASILRVTANGTTTSPVIRGAGSWNGSWAWRSRRLPPAWMPSSPIPGARSRSANNSTSTARPRRVPPAIASSIRPASPSRVSTWRAVGGIVIVPPEVESRPRASGKNGHLFKFHHAQEVDCAGELADGRPFSDIRDLKTLLAADDRQLARNLVQRLVVFSTGAPVSFADRAEVESILDRTAAKGYRVRSLIHEVVQSELFRYK